MKSKKTKIGIVGCGAIGLELAKAIESRFKQKAVLAAICDIDQIKIDNFLSRIKDRPLVCSLKELIKKSDFIVEAASAGAAAEVAKKALSAKKDVLIMSVGGLLKGAKGIFNLAQKNRARIHIPSGALAGLDGLKGALIAGVDKITLTTKKPPRALEGAPFLAKNSINLSGIQGERLLFEGDVDEAVRGFPKNINVAATLSLICGEPDKVRVKIVAAPDLRTNVHEVQIEGKFGRLLARTENLPSPGNPKTSYLAALSAIAALEAALSNVKIGT